MQHRSFLFVGLILVACWHGASGADPDSSAGGSQLFAPRHVTQLKRATSVAISPSGKFAAYGVAVQRRPLEDEDGAAWIELHVVDAQGNARPFVTGKVNVSEIQWTPDGSQIAYVAKRNDDEHRSLYVIPLDGGESRRLIQHKRSLRGVAFCPVDDRIAFLAKEAEPKEEKELKDQGFNQDIYEEDEEPTRVWLTTRNAAEPRSLDLEGHASYVEFSPDGRYLAVVLAPSPLVDDSYMFKRVHVVDADSGRIVQSIENPGKLGAVRWSPDGKHLALISAVDINDPSEGHLMVAAVPGDGALRDLTPQLEGHVNSIAWQDPATLWWIADVRQATEIGTITLAGETTVVVADSDVVFSGLSLADDGTSFAALGHCARFPHEVFVSATSRPEPRRLSDLNPWLADMRFANQRVVQWKARDGLELEGVLIQPLNYVEGRRYPMIMTVHGGPEAHVSNGWVTSYSYAGQVGAARGFVVFYPNYRGSTGRGVEFSKLGQEDAAGKEFDDLVDAIDALSEQGLVDQKRVGITGGSYGGFASAWGATYYSDRYAASVMFVGISDNISKVGTTDIPEEMYHVHHLKRLWDDWDYFAQRSPIRHVQKNRTPTLILHGKNDPRVHPSQSLELHRHLKTLKQAPVRLVLYEGEGHGNRKAAARLDYNVRLLRWMEHYLQGPGGNPPAIKIDYKAALGTE